LPGATTANTNQRRLTYLTNPPPGSMAEIQQTDPAGTPSTTACFFQSNATSPTITPF